MGLITASRGLSPLPHPPPPAYLPLAASDALLAAQHAQRDPAVHKHAVGHPEPGPYSLASTSIAQKDNPEYPARFQTSIPPSLPRGAAPDYIA
ncbi:hypothetical protein PsYK624_136350 [Phanerochaete sordida]|uniref:Uncharacterized protein n=1 Tax=Phanerochaete sordida TaxID=48140 RepID=A0A9P3GKZ5_9APHY|nr:hypothetical protein PsYK624_136350 [Phanerochaete sordida]